MCSSDKTSFPFFRLTGSTDPLSLVFTTQTLPDNKKIQERAENNLLTVLSSEEVKSELSEALSGKLYTHTKLTHVRVGSIRVDMILGDLSRVENLKELSDKGVLSNIMDNILMTPEFIESCQAGDVVIEDVAIEVVLDEKSYQRIKNRPGECNVHVSLDCMNHFI